MNQEIDNYLASLRRRLFWMDRKTRMDVLLEVQSHLAERTKRGDAAQVVIDKFGSAKFVAREYMKVYGFGIVFVFELMLLGALLAILTVPAFFQQSQDLLDVTWLSLGFFAAGIALIIISSIKGGRRAGIAVGTSECTVRFIVLGVLAIGGNVTYSDGYLGPIGFVVASLFLPFIGYLSGSVKTVKKSEI